MTYLQPLGIASQHAGEIQLFHLLFQSARQTGVHARSTREYDVFIELGTGVYCSLLDRLEEEFYMRVGKGETGSRVSPRFVCEASLMRNTVQLACHSRLFDIDEMRLEHAFRGLVPL